METIHTPVSQNSYNRNTPYSAISDISDTSEYDFEPLQLEDLMDHESVSVSIPTTQADIWGEGVMPDIPEYEVQQIDINSEGYDPFNLENIKIKDYLAEDINNIAILYAGKVYLSSRFIIQSQDNNAIVYECLKANSRKRSNVIGNLPLYNIKKIGLNLSSDSAVGVEPEFVYTDGIDKLLDDDNNVWQYYSIIHLKNLVSIISADEASRLGTDFAGISSLHCQAGQGGLAGIIVRAKPIETKNTGGKKRKTIKKRNLHKKTKKVKSGKKTTLKKSKKQNKSLAKK
jgi:hypothetical protein